MNEFNVLLFEQFETLDAFGPAEILGKLPGGTIHYFSELGGIVTSRQGVPVVTKEWCEINPSANLVIPGGWGTRSLIEKRQFIQQLAQLCAQAEFVLSICTGSALLAQTNLLNGRRATSNKLALDWVKAVQPHVNWLERARWAVDGKYYTSSGVSAGMDMTLGFIADQLGEAAAREIAFNIEYVWHEDRENDPFYIKR